ncbi:MAG: ribosome silencing factor [Rubrivivax sp.]|nr:ribosome silencing factor [Rubrivivax sp.]
MDIRKLQRAIVDGLEDVKGQNIAVFNTEHLSPLFERVIIASGTSNRQTRALASSVRESVKAHGLQVLRTEGEDNGEWIIVDCGAAVAHIMQPAVRDYYHLEEIWGGKAVRMKRGDVVAAETANRSAPAKRASAEPEPVAAPARKRAPAAAAKAAAPAKKPAPARKAAPAQRAAPAHKAAPAKKAAPARKAAPAKKTAPRRGTPH